MLTTIAFAISDVILSPRSMRAKDLNPSPNSPLLT